MYASFNLNYKNFTILEFTLDAGLLITIMNKSVHIGLKQKDEPWFSIHKDNFHQHVLGLNITL